MLSLERQTEIRSRPLTQRTLCQGDTLQLADTIDGGDGNDTLPLLLLTKKVQLKFVNLTSIENISIRTSDDDDNTGSSFNASSAGGLTNFTLDRITDDFTVTGSTAVKTKIFDNSTGEDVSIAYASVTGSADTATIEADKLGTTNLVIGDGIETVSLSSPWHEKYEEGS